MNRLLTAASAAVLLASGAAIKPAPAQAWGYNQQRCWVEVHYYEKNWGGCFPQQRNSSGQVVHVCCG